MEATLDRMRQIPLSTTATIEVVAIATFVWLADFGCLVASFGAVHATVPVYGVLLAYGVAQVVGSLPFIPGGIGIIESQPGRDPDRVRRRPGLRPVGRAGLPHHQLLARHRGRLDHDRRDRAPSPSSGAPAVSAPPAYADESSSQSDQSAARPDHTPG